MVQHQQVELTVGDVVRIGDTVITVVDIENGEITFRIDDADSSDEDLTNDQSDNLPIPLPR